MSEQAGLNLSNRIQIASKLAMRFSNVLEMSEEDASRLAGILESNPVFQKFFRPKDPEWKVFARQRFPSSKLSTSFYRVPETSQIAVAPEIESTLEAHSRLVEKIKDLGSEKFEKYFLYEDGDRTPDAIALELGIPRELTLEIRKLTDLVMMNPDFFTPASVSQVQPRTRSTCLAQINCEIDGKPEISFLSPTMALGTYKIDYEKLRQVKSKGFLSDQENRSLQETIRMLEMINSRRTLIYRILLSLPKWQVNFFKDRDWDSLAPLSQKAAADELKVTPAAVCRAIQDRSVLVLEGEEASLVNFFPSKKDIHKRKISDFVKKSGSLTDLELTDALSEKFGLKLSRRSVNVYRNEILGKKKRH